MSSLSPSRTTPIFISFASTSPKDLEGFNDLVAHLSPLFSSYFIPRCYDSRFGEQSPTVQLINAHLDQATIIVMLISANFLASKQDEIQRAIELKEAGKAIIIPVLLRSTAWETSPLSQYQRLPSDGQPISLWPDRDAAFTDVVQGIRRVANGIISQEIKLTQSPLQSVILYDPPDPYDNLFIDRESTLDKISSFFGSTHTGQTALLALSGPRGVGKTAIAKQYYARFADRYQDILWLNASSRVTLSTYVNTLVDLLSLPDTARENEQQFFADLKRWLRDRPRWLLVLDQIRDVTLVDLIVPPRSSGRVLLTMRTRNIKKRASLLLSVPSMDVDSGALLLLRRAQVLADQASLKQAPTETVRLAKEMALAMGGSPLTLDKAGADLLQKGMNLAHYLSLYEERRAHMLSKRKQVKSNQSISVKEIFALTLDDLSDTPHADLLHLLSFLPPDVVIDGLLVNGAQELHEPLRSLVADSFALHQALDELYRSNLVSYQIDGEVVRIRPIVQEVIIDRLAIEQRRYWAEQVVRLVNRVFPDVHFDTRIVCERYLPQADHCATLIATLHLTLKEGALLLERAGSFCAQQASYVEAEKYLTQARDLYEHDEHTNVLNTAQTLNSLGLLYRQQARYEEAEMIHQDALALREQVLGQNDAKTMESLHNLAMIYGDLGRYQQAVHFFSRVLTIEEEAKGPNHTDVADTLNELGLTYAQQGRIAEAEIAARRALTIYEQARDADHPDLTYPLDTLGTLAEQQSDYQQAEAFYERALEICLVAFGEEHPETAHSRYRLAGLAVSRGEYQDAENLYQQVLNIYEQKLGSNHPDVALILNDQALLATKQKQYKKAESLYERALDIYESVLGKEHPDVASVLNNLGELARMTGDKQRAKTLLQRSLFIREKTFDPTHPSIAQSLNNLARLQDDK